MALITNWYFIVIQNLHQTPETHSYANLKNINQTPKNFMGMKIYSQLNFKKKEKMEKNGNKKEKK